MGQKGHNVGGGNEPKDEISRKGDPHKAKRSKGMPNVRETEY